MIRRRNKYKNANQVQNAKGNRWYLHYYQYLCSLAYQLFEWENLPPSIDPRYLEMNIHMLGHVGFYKDPEMGYIVSKGALGGYIDHYDLPTTYQAYSPRYQKTFRLYNYNDIKDDKSSVFEYCDGKISTPKYKIEWNEYGQLTSIFDKENKREVLAKGERGNVLQIFEDKPMAHEAWDIDIFYKQCS